MQFKAIVDGTQVGKINTSRNGCWNVLLEYSGSNYGWKFDYEKGRHLYQGTVTKLGYNEGTQEYSWVTVPYEIVRIE